MTKKTKAKSKKQEQEVQQKPMESTGNEAPLVIDEDDFEDLEAQPGNAVEGAPVLQAADEAEILEINLGKSLRRKLFKLAHDEGISAEELCQEMIAEGVVLRAWEVIGRNKVQQGHSGGNQPNQKPGQNRGGHNRKGRRNKGRGGGGGGGNWMEDKAAFLEYVRNQERSGRR